MNVAGVKIKTPECDKMLAVKDESQSIGTFLEWLMTEGFNLAKYHGEACPDCGLSTERLYSEHITVENLLAQYFGIDLSKAEAEKRAILEALRG